MGIKLSVAAQKMKSPKTSSDDSQNTSLPWTSTLVILLTRFVLWPAISIPLIYLLATRTSWVLDDPLLWFCLMLMPTGPPALKLTALADVNGAGEEEKLGIAKLLIVSTDRLLAQQRRDKLTSLYRSHILFHLSSRSRSWEV